MLSKAMAISCRWPWHRAKGKASAVSSVERAQFTVCVIKIQSRERVILCSKHERQMASGLHLGRGSVHRLHVSSFLGFHAFWCSCVSSMLCRHIIVLVEVLASDLDEDLDCFLA